MPLVDDAQVTLASEGIDAELPVEHIAYEVERIPVHASLSFCRRRPHESPELSFESGHGLCVDCLQVGQGPTMGPRTFHTCSRPALPAHGPLTTRRRNVTVG